MPSAMRTAAEAAAGRGGLIPRLAAVVRRTTKRRHVDASLDWLRFRLDTFPRSRLLARWAGVAYPPLPWVGLRDAPRRESTASRWRAMGSVLKDADVVSAVDVGCNWGFFTLSLASEGILTVGIDDDPPAFRTALYAARKAGFQNVGLWNMRISPETVELIPSADAILFLAVWHHFVHDYGFDRATDMLEKLWQRSGKVLCFDTGEREMPPSFGLPAMQPTPEVWLTRYLEDTCAGGSVLHLGAHPALTPDLRPCRRNLFAVLR